MDAEDLRHLAATVYGSDWQTRLSEDAGVSDRTVRRWASGESPVPDDIEPLLRQIAQRRIAEIVAAIGG